MPFHNIMDRSPEDILHEEQESEMPGTLGEGRRPGLGLPYVRGVEEHHVLSYSYWNANGKGICIAAVEGGAADWAAYIGADDGMRTEDCVEWTKRHGCKLSRKQANRWFPELPIEAYRE
ncbi:hypothetical protein LCGC14_1320990 [marine sediment metagenome]|uniref:Uncharacterized protein n=1 Tax=marine sediment metagenome TaxID=412755 RepID=A0A0F9KK33_9ZZZZ